MKLLVNGAERIEDVPGLDAAQEHADIVFAPDNDRLGEQLPGTDILLGWNFQGRGLRNQWAQADRLKWVHWCGAGVDAVLFPELAASDTVLTNSRGIFDKAIAEYVLGYMLAEVKDFHSSLRFQAEKTWQFRMTAKLSGGRAVIFGVGSIGREIGTLLKAVGVNVTGVGRSRRSGDPVFEEIYAHAEAREITAQADWIIGVMPLTNQTKGFFDAKFFASLKSGARFVNVGRGQSVDEVALCAALSGNRIAGAMLDVFLEEPLPQSSPLWKTPNLFISPHMSGDYEDSLQDLAALFLENLDRFIGGRELLNVVNKDLGFVHSGQG